MKPIFNLTAAKVGVDLSSDLPAKQRAEKDRLSKLSGADFDKAYMATMVKDHRKDVADFKREASDGQNEDVRTFASQTLPILEEHLKIAERSNAKINGTSSPASLQ